MRAHRRWRELCDAGSEITEAEVLADLKARDARDAARAVAPLRAAEDAVTLDTTRLTIPDAVARTEAVVARALAVRG